MCAKQNFKETTLCLPLSEGLPLPDPYMPPKNPRCVTFVPAVPPPPLFLRPQASSENVHSRQPL